MTKNIAALFLASFLIGFIPPVYSRECYFYFKKYKIDPEIKSAQGWSRVIKRDKLDLYIYEQLTTQDDIFLKKCLQEFGFDIENYRRGIGEKLWLKL